MNIEWFADHFYNVLFLGLSLSHASARSQWQFVGKAWWGQTLWLLRWKVGERMIIGYMRSASSPSCILLLFIVNIIDQNHCNSKPTFFSSSVLVDRMLGTPPPNPKINIPNKILTLFHYSPVKLSSCYCLNFVSGFKQNCVLGRFVTIWLLIPVYQNWYYRTSVPELILMYQCTRTASDTTAPVYQNWHHCTSLPEQLLIPECRAVAAAVRMVEAIDTFHCLQLSPACDHLLWCQKI